MASHSAHRAQATAMLKKGIISQKAHERMMAKIAALEAAQEQAQATEEAQEGESAAKVAPVAAAPAMPAPMPTAAPMPPSGAAQPDPRMATA